MSLLPYITLMKRGNASFVVNKSRFIGDVAPCETEDAALRFLGEIRQSYKDATHHCYAYILGVNQGVMRYSDDGEPGGTAGLPIMDVLRGKGVTNCCAVVTRYFGGVLLGTGGLVRAYTQGAACAVADAGVGVMHPTVRFAMDVPYPLLGRLEYTLRDAPIRIEDKQFADVVTLTYLTRVADAADVTARIVSACEGRVEPIPFEEMYEAWPE